MNTNDRVIIQPYGEAALTRTCQGVLGIDLTGLWLGRDAVFNGLDVCTALLPRVGNPAYNVSVTNFFTKTVVNGRTGLYCAGGTDARMSAVIATAPVEAWAVAIVNPVPSADYACLLSSWKTSVGINRYLQCTQASNAWYGAVGSDHYRDGIASDQYDNTIRVYSGDITVGELAADQLIFGNDQGAFTTRSFAGSMFAFMTASRVTSAPDRLVLANAFLRYMTALT
jgi:hypothetical protein